MRKERILSIGSIIQTIYIENIMDVNDPIMQECRESNEFYKKYQYMLSPDAAKKKYSYFVEQCEKIMKKSEIKKEILDYISSSCIEYDNENYNVIVTIEEDLSGVKDILLSHVKLIISRIIRTEKFVYEVLKACNKNYLPSENLDFITRKFGEKYAIYELLLILINNFVNEKNMHVNTAIESSLRILKMLYGERFEHIFGTELVEDKNLSYEEFYSYLVEPHVENLSFDKEVLKSIEDIYSKI